MFLNPWVPEDELLHFEKCLVKESWIGIQSIIFRRPANSLHTLHLELSHFNPTIGIQNNINVMFAKFCPRGDCEWELLLDIWEPVREWLSWSVHSPFVGTRTKYKIPTLGNRNETLLLMTNTDIQMTIAEANWLLSRYGQSPSTSPPPPSHFHQQNLCWPGDRYTFNIVKNMKTN